MTLCCWNKFVCATFIVFSQASCDSQGHGGVSIDVNESKRRAIFINEYEVIPNPYTINDSLKITVTSAWLESQWSYGKSQDVTIIVKGEYQLVLQVNPLDVLNYGVTWTIGIDGNRYLRSCGTNCLITDFVQLPMDTEEWKVQNGWKLDSLSKKTIIGNFKIHRKKPLH